MTDAARFNSCHMPGLTTAELLATHHHCQV